MALEASDRLTSELTGDTQCMHLKAHLKQTASLSDMMAQSK